MTAATGWRLRMPSDDLAIRLRCWETALDAPIPRGFQIGARRDGRSFTRLIHEVCTCDEPLRMNGCSAPHQLR